MSNNRPFTSECRNMFSETTYNTIPQPFGLDNMTATQAQNRTIYDTISTHTAANPQPQLQMPLSHQYFNLNYPQVIYAQPQLIPGGVSFTFNPTPEPQHNLQGFSIAAPQMHPYLQTQQAQEQQHQQLLTPQFEAALQLLEQQGLELMLLQQHLQKSPYKLQFHQNGQTSTTDLLRGPSQIPKSQGMPDFKNALRGATDSATSTSSPNILCTEAYQGKRLLLTKSPDIQNKQTLEQKPNNQGGKCDRGKSESKEQHESKPDQRKEGQTSKRVSFNDGKTKSKKSKKPKKHSKSKRKCYRLHSSEESDKDDEYSDDGYDEDEDYY